MSQLMLERPQGADVAAAEPQPAAPESRAAYRDPYAVPDDDAGAPSVLLGELRGTDATCGALADGQLGAWEADDELMAAMGLADVPGELGEMNGETIDEMSEVGPGSATVVAGKRVKVGHTSTSGNRGDGDAAVCPPDGEGPIRDDDEAADGEAADDEAADGEAADGEAADGEAADGEAADDDREPVARRKRQWCRRCHRWSRHIS